MYRQNPVYNICIPSKIYRYWAMINFENYTIRPLEVSDLKPYFNLVEKNRKRLEDFFTGTVSRTKDFTETEIFLTELTEKRENKQYFPFILIDN